MTEGLAQHFTVNACVIWWWQKQKCIDHNCAKLEIYPSLLFSHFKVCTIPLVDFICESILEFPEKIGFLMEAIILFWSESATLKNLEQILLVNWKSKKILISKPDLWNTKQNKPYKF